MSLSSMPRFSPVPCKEESIGHDKYEKSEKNDAYHEILTDLLELLNNDEDRVTFKYLLILMKNDEHREILTYSLQRLNNDQHREILTCLLKLFKNDEHREILKNSLQRLKSCETSSRLGQQWTTVFLKRLQEDMEQQEGLENPLEKSSCEQEIDNSAYQQYDVKFEDTVNKNVPKPDDIQDQEDELNRDLAFKCQDKCDIKKEDNGSGEDLLQVSFDSKDETESNLKAEQGHNHHFPALTRSIPHSEKEFYTNKKHNKKTQTEPESKISKNQHFEVHKDNQKNTNPRQDTYDVKVEIYNSRDPDDYELVMVGDTDEIKLEDNCVPDGDLIARGYKLTMRNRTH